VVITSPDTLTAISASFCVDPGLAGSHSNSFSRAVLDAPGASTALLLDQQD
jgi:hypothetical protein